MTFKLQSLLHVQLVLKEKGFVVPGYFDRLGILNTKNGQKNYLSMVFFFFARMSRCWSVAGGPPKQKAGNFIERMLLRLKLQTRDSLKPRFWTGASYLLV